MEKAKGKERWKMTYGSEEWMHSFH